MTLAVDQAAGHIHQFLHDRSQAAAFGRVPYRNIRAEEGNCLMPIADLKNGSVRTVYVGRPEWGDSKGLLKFNNYLTR